MHQNAVERHVSGFVGGVLKTGKCQTFEGTARLETGSLAAGPDDKKHHSSSISISYTGHCLSRELNGSNRELRVVNYKPSES